MMLLASEQGVIHAMIINQGFGFHSELGRAVLNVSTASLPRQLTVSWRIEDGDVAPMVRSFGH